MNITLDFYVDGSEARLVNLNYNGYLPRDKRGYVTTTTEKLAEEYVKAIEAILALPGQGPKPEPIDDPHIGEDPIPVPTPVNPPVEVMSVKPEPVEEKPVTLEDVRKALIEVKKTKGTEALKNCFSVVGATKLPDVDPTDYAALLSAAKGALDAK